MHAHTEGFVGTKGSLGQNVCRDKVFIGTKCSLGERVCRFDYFVQRGGRGRTYYRLALDLIAVKHLELLPAQLWQRRLPSRPFPLPPSLP